MKHDHCTRTPTKHSAASAQRVYMAAQIWARSLVTYQCCWSDFAEHSSTVPHSTCACIHVDLHVCSPCQSLPHSARLSAPSARFCSVSENARFCSNFCRHYPPTPSHMTVTRAITNHFATSRPGIARLQHCKHVSKLYSISARLGHGRAEIENIFDLCGESQHGAPWSTMYAPRMGYEKIDWWEKWSQPAKKLITERPHVACNL